MKYNYVEFVVPQWAIPYLANGDASGLSEEEEKLVKEFEEEVTKNFGAGHWSFGIDRDEFRAYNDITSEGGSTETIHWVIVG